MRVEAGDGPGESTGKASLGNANGVEALSPGLVRGTRTYPGVRIGMRNNRNAVAPWGVAAETATIRTTGMGRAATALRLGRPIVAQTQGSLAGSATLGWGPESRWDSDRGTGGGG